jgi:hypothetical protein
MRSLRHSRLLSTLTTGARSAQSAVTAVSPDCTITTTSDMLAQGTVATSRNLAADNRQP